MDKANFETLFPYMNDIFYDDIDFAERVDNQRKSIYYSEKSFLEREGETYTYDTWNTLPNGRIGILYEDWQFECLFHRKNGPLYVILNGALSGNKPEFKRWSYYNFLPGSMLNIADPMYYQFKDLKLGWYYGDEKHNLREYLSKVIIKAARMLGLSNKDIVIIGSSGGGSAAIQTGSFIPGSTVIAINAQIKLSLYYYHEKFRGITGIDLSGEDYFGRNDTLYCLQNENQSPTQYILIDNIKSQVDCDQINYMLTELPIKLKYGISQWDNLTVWLYDAVLSDQRGAHGAQEYHQILFVIIFLAECVAKRVSLADYEHLFLLFSEFWNDHFELIDQGHLK